MDGLAERLATSINEITDPTDRARGLSLQTKVNAEIEAPAPENMA